MKSFSRENQDDIIEAFRSTFRYLDDLSNIDNVNFEQLVKRTSYRAAGEVGGGGGGVGGRG